MKSTDTDFARAAISKAYCDDGQAYYAALARLLDALDALDQGSTRTEAADAMEIAHARRAARDLLRAGGYYDEPDQIALDLD